MNEKFKLADGRSTRLFGANIFFDNSGAVIDVPAIENQDQIVQIWLNEVNRILPNLGWEPNYLTGYKKYSRGIRFAISAPFDLLWAATDLLEYLWSCVRHTYELGVDINLDDAMSTMQPIIERHTNLEYREVYLKAKSLKLNVFEDGKRVTIGSGKFSYTVERNKLSFAHIPWDAIREIPTVMVTGTNGKTTTVRLTRFIAKQSGAVVGYCSSDWIMIGDEVVETGDLSGPSGNQGVMMHPAVEIAVLEVARGGLLRRGILTNFIQGATVTNISEDHLGEDGVDTVEELAQAKALVYKALDSNGYAIINLDDELIRENSKNLIGNKIYITKDINNPNYIAYLKDASWICYIKDNAFYWREKNQDQLIATFADTPITVNGYAMHNIENAMHAIALSYSLGYGIDHIGKSLQQYENTAENNQGRANVFDYNGGKIVVDFAHNVAGLDAMMHLSKQYIKPGGRFGILFGNTGNRVYLLDKMTEIIAKNSLDIIVIKEMTSYLRGTEPGELVKQANHLLVNKGIDSKKIHLVDNEFMALDIALDFVKSGDVFLFIAHEAISEIIMKLNIIINKEF